MQIAVIMLYSFKVHFICRMTTVDPNSMSNMNNMVLEFGRCGLILQLKPSMWNRDDLIFGLRFMHGLVLWISPGYNGYFRDPSTRHFGGQSG